MRLIASSEFAKEDPEISLWSLAFIKVATVEPFEIRQLGLIAH
jgi:hypothetical protein